MRSWWVWWIITQTVCPAVHCYSILSGPPPPPTLLHTHTHTHKVLHTSIDRLEHKPGSNTAVMFLKDFRKFSLEFPIPEECQDMIDALEVLSQPGEWKKGVRQSESVIYSNTNQSLLISPPLLYLSPPPLSSLTSPSSSPSTSSSSHSSSHLLLYPSRVATAASCLLLHTSCSSPRESMEVCFRARAFHPLALLREAMEN